MNKTMTNTTNCRIRIPAKKQTFNEFVQARPKYQSADIHKVWLIWQEYLIDNYGELAMDQPEANLNIWDL